MRLKSKSDATTTGSNTHEAKAHESERSWLGDFGSCIHNKKVSLNERGPNKLGKCDGKVALQKRFRETWNCYVTEGQASLSRSFIKVICEPRTKQSKSNLTIQIRRNCCPRWELSFITCENTTLRKNLNNSRCLAVGIDKHFTCCKVEYY